MVTSTQKSAATTTSNPSGWSNVVNVFKSIVTLQPIQANTGNKVTDKIVGVTAQAAGTAALGLAVLGGGALAIDTIGAGSAGAATAAKAAATTGGAAAASTSSMTPYLVGGAIGAGAAYLLNSGSKQTATTKSDQTNQQTPSITPTITPQQYPQYQPTTYITPSAIQSGQGNILNQNTYSYNDQYSYQTTYTPSSLAATQTPSVDLATDQTASGSNTLLWVALGIAAIMLVKD